MMDYFTFTDGLLAAPWKKDICPGCGGTGWKPVMCCNGQKCGCMGMPVDFILCDCGITPATDEQIKQWYEDSKSKQVSMYDEKT